MEDLFKQIKQEKTQANDLDIKQERSSSPSLKDILIRKMQKRKLQQQQQQQQQESENSTNPYDNIKFEPSPKSELNEIEEKDEKEEEKEEDKKSIRNNSRKSSLKKRKGTNTTSSPTKEKSRVIFNGEMSHKFAKRYMGIDSESFSKKKKTMVFNNDEFNLVSQSTNAKEEANQSINLDETQNSKKEKTEQHHIKAKLYSKYSDLVIGDRKTEEEKIQLGIKKREVENKEGIMERFGIGIDLKKNKAPVKLIAKKESIDFEYEKNKSTNRNKSFIKFVKKGPEIEKEKEEKEKLETKENFREIRNKAFSMNYNEQTTTQENKQSNYGIKDNLARKIREQFTNYKIIDLKEPDKIIECF